MLFGDVWEVSLASGRPRNPARGLGSYSESGGVSPPPWGLFPTPNPQSLSEHVAPTRGMLANVPQQWISSSKLASSAQPDPSPVPARWSVPWKSAWARVPFPDTCCFQAWTVSHSHFVSYAPFFPIHEGINPQPFSLLPRGCPDTPLGISTCARPGRPSELPQTASPFFLSCWGCSSPGNQEPHLATAYLSPN